MPGRRTDFREPGMSSRRAAASKKRAVLAIKDAGKTGKTGGKCSASPTMGDLWFPGLNDFAVLHDTDPVRTRESLILFVDNKDYRAAGLGLNSPELRPHLKTETLIKVPERLVEERQFRHHDQ